MVSFAKNPYTPAQQKIADDHGRNARKGTFTVEYTARKTNQRDKATFPAPIINADVPLAVVAYDGNYSYYVDEYGNILKTTFSSTMHETVDELGARGEERRAIMEDAHANSATANVVIAVDCDGETALLTVCEQPLGILYRSDGGRATIIDVSELAGTVRGVGHFILPLSNARHYEKMARDYSPSNKFAQLSVNPTWNESVARVLEANDAAATEIVGAWMPHSNEEFTTTLSMCRMFDTMLVVPTAQDVDRMFSQWQSIREHYV